MKSLNPESRSKENGFRKAAIRRTKASGTIMVFALLVLAVAAIGMSGWVYLMGSLAKYQAESYKGMERRMGLENSRALATQFFREKVLLGGLTNGYSGTVTWSGHALGKVAINGVPGIPTSATSQGAGENPFSPGGAVSSATDGFRGYSVSSTGTLGSEDSAWSFESRSRAPMFGYDLISRGSVGTLGSLGVTNTAAFGTTNGPTIGPTAGGNLFNIASPPVIRGPETYFSQGFATEIVLSSQVPLPPANDLAKLLTYHCDGAGNVTIFLKRVFTETRFYVAGSPTSLTFSDDASVAGANVSTWEPIRVLINGVTANFPINVPVESRRRLFVGVKGTGNPTVTVVPQGTSSVPPVPLRLSGYFDGVTVAFSLAGALSITGGVELNNSSATASGGGVTFARDTDPGRPLEAMGYRRAWLEAYRND